MLYSLDNLEQVPTMIRDLLQNEIKRRKIAAAGYQRAHREHTWKKRVDDILQKIEQEE